MKEQSEQKTKEIKEIFFIEHEIKNKIKCNNLSKPIFKKYILLNKDWFVKYKKSLYNKQKENLFNNDSFFPLFIENNEIYNEQIYSFFVPNNFIIVTEKFIKLLFGTFEQKYQQILNELLFDIMVGGECIIIKDKKYANINYISLYNSNNQEFCYNNNIDYILIYDNQQKMEICINNFLKYNFLNYFKLIDINLENNEKQKIICNEEEIGYIIPSNNLNFCETLKDINSFFNYYIFIFILINIINLKYILIPLT